MSESLLSLGVIYYTSIMWQPNLIIGLVLIILKVSLTFASSSSGQKARVVFVPLVRVDGFNRGNGHINSGSNCLQHAARATYSLLINVENCSLSPLPALGSNATSIFSSFFFSCPHLKTLL